ncbi:TPA: hypothetical protein ACIN8C_001306 [Streptococcus agalactiae]
MIAYAGTISGGRLDIATDVEMVAGGDIYLLQVRNGNYLKKPQ